MTTIASLNLQCRAHFSVQTGQSKVVLFCSSLEWNVCWNFIDCFYVLYFYLEFLKIDFIFFICLFLFPYTFHTVCCLTILFDDTGLKNKTNFSFLQRNRKLPFALQVVYRRNTSMNSKLGLRLSMRFSLLKLKKLSSEALLGVVESSEK